MILRNSFKLCLTNFARIQLRKCSSITNAPATKINETPKKIECYGQPHYKTHPHVLQPGEITPCVTISEYKQRRCNLLQAIQKYSIDVKSNLRNHIVIIPSANKKYMSGKIPYVFRQNTEFFYLTGCLEPDSILILTINDKQEMKSYLLLRPKDKNAEMWDGPRTGSENGLLLFGVDETNDVKNFKLLLENLQKCSTNSVVWYDQRASDLHHISNQIKSLVQTDIMLKSPTSFLHSLRVIKSPSEVLLMRKSCEIISESINETIEESKPGDSEHHIFARLDYKCRMKNASYLAYPPVVATGTNGTTIHYINNTQLTKDNDLVLVDAGCEYGGYTSDVTRTWPINGHFNDAQRTLYEVVLDVQKQLIDILLKPGGETLDRLFDTMCFKLGVYLQEIHLLPKDLTGLSLERATYNFCPHHVSHYLGMDVHDTALISRSTNLLPGMTFTVEPGIYIAEDRTDVPPEFRGIGIRIEDNVLINSSNGIEVLTKNCVKEVSQIENLTDS